MMGQPTPSWRHPLWIAMPTYTRDIARDIRTESVAQVYTQAVRAGDQETLRLLARAIARDLRRQDLTPEQMLLRVKASLPDASATAQTDPTNGSWTTYERVVSWCIAEYFSVAE
jgi:hypothetical protein